MAAPLPGLELKRRAESTDLYNSSTSSEPGKATTHPQLIANTPLCEAITTELRNTNTPHLRLLCNAGELALPNCSLSIEMVFTANLAMKFAL